MVVLGLTVQVAWYLFQMAVVARMTPWRFLSGALDVMASTFSTASTAATIPITLRSLERLGISRRSSQLTACIGTNFNNDGTALYQATAALFIAQALGYQLSLTDQVVIMLTTLIASVGAGGIPSGSFVTMPLIFAAVRLPSDKIPILLTVDWLLDRCRTTSNVLGDMTVAVLLDRVSPPDGPSGERVPGRRAFRDRDAAGAVVAGVNGAHNSPRTGATATFCRRVRGLNPMVYRRPRDLGLAPPGYILPPRSRLEPGGLPPSPRPGAYAARLHSAAAFAA